MVKYPGFAVRADVRSQTVTGRMYELVQPLPDVLCSEILALRSWEVRVQDAGPETENVGTEGEGAPKKNKEIGRYPCGLPRARTSMGSIQTVNSLVWYRPP